MTAASGLTLHVICDLQNCHLKLKFTSKWHHRICTIFWNTNRPHSWWFSVNGFLFYELFGHEPLYPSTGESLVSPFPVHSTYVALSYNSCIPRYFGFSLSPSACDVLTFLSRLVLPIYLRQAQRIRMRGALLSRPNSLRLHSMAPEYRDIFVVILNRVTKSRSYSYICIETFRKGVADSYAV
jgi:hypothetical protein